MSSCILGKLAKKKKRRQKNLIQQILYLPHFLSLFCIQRVPQGKDTEPSSCIPPHGLAPPRNPPLWLRRRELLFSFLLLGLVESDSSPVRSVVPAVQRKEISLPVSGAAQLGLGVSAKN